MAEPSTGMMRKSTESSDPNFGARDAWLEELAIALRQETYRPAAHALAAEHKVGQVDASITPSNTSVGSTIAFQSFTRPFAHS